MSHAQSEKKYTAKYYVNSPTKVIKFPMVCGSCVLSASFVSFFCSLMHGTKGFLSWELGATALQENACSLQHWHTCAYHLGKPLRVLGSFHFPCAIMSFPPILFPEYCQGWDSVHKFKFTTK